MKHKSLRQLAGELGVSASYLSQVAHGKKRLSERLHKVLTSVNQLEPSSTQDLATKLAVHIHNPKVVSATRNILYLTLERPILQANNR